MSDRHYHVNRNGDRLSWAEVAETRLDATRMYLRLSRAKVGRPRDTYAVEECHDGQCAEYVAYRAHEASVPPVSMP
jgi:hypothetical protein